MISTFAAAIAAHVSGLHGPALYAVVGLLAFGEGAAFLGLVLPGETAVFLGAALAAQGHARLAILVVVVAAAAVAGDAVGYEVGRRLGPRVRTGPLGRRIGASRWHRAETAIERRGAVAVVLGRWVGLLRALVPAAAGATRMPYRRFLVANAAGGVSWALAVSLLGYGAGVAWPQVQAWLGRGSMVLVAAVLLFLLGGRVRRRGTARRRAFGPHHDQGSGSQVSPQDAEQEEHAMCTAASVPSRPSA
ncbi:DedA family protein [Georgenia yuyongxinii]|uniref:DedA family protein n=1 Tax=Georgenia yuyongxinii TaxID=2589797 RepID=A0A552WVJ0_9MICO|nr:DedA family protein [Georgenia yuyongxinii]TRW46735.1 DedA family protein [Georgenia yuyongxinii]